VLFRSLAKRTKLHQSWLIRIPEGSRLSLRQWAAFSLRYVTAWANWQASYGCWCALSGGGAADVWGWGGGVTYAQLTLARLLGSEATMITSDDSRLRLLEASGLRSVDRREFPHLAFDADRYAGDESYKEAYQASETRFLDIVQERTEKRGVDIFVDYIGLPVHRATLKSLGRPGVITTAGWKEGMMLNTVRALECMRWHAHVHTHYARYDQALAAMAFAEENAWAPPLEGERVYSWEEIPDLAEAYAANRVTSFFPIFAVNPEG
jgi:NADPH:quinone reductase-like Zn-dependent oxidoreductase